jgi:hypothetical protein
MAIRVPSPTDVGAKWASVTPSRAGDYTRGVQGAGQAWQQGVDGADDTWAAAVQEAAASGRWGRAVQGRGGFYAQQAAQLGAPRWSAGVTAARDRYTASMGPVLSTIGGLTLPPRLPAGSPGNMERSRIVGAALHAMKIGS